MDINKIQENNEFKSIFSVLIFLFLLKNERLNPDIEKKVYSHQ
jgi:hypothetical protein